MSDTVTRPSEAMRAFMMRAEVGDDVFGEDPTVNDLEQKVAQMFGHDAALFCPSGTMTNQIAIQLHTGRLGEVICEESSHIYQYETGGYAYNARCAINLIAGQNGKMTADQVEMAIKPKYDWLPESALVSIENSCNKGGGNYYNWHEAKAIQKVCQENDMAYHLDGARIFNVLAETNDTPDKWGQLFDTISICLSKGLGAPVGSLLAGSAHLIAQARRLRKVMGGGMRQAGILAAAGIYALENNIERLKIDNDRASEIGQVLLTKSFIKKVRPVRTNIVIAATTDDFPAVEFVHLLERKNIRAVALGKNLIRFVTHLDITAEMMDKLLNQLKKI